MAHSSYSAAGCPGFRHARRIARREVLRIGGLFGLGLTLPSLFGERARAAPVLCLFVDCSFTFIVFVKPDTQQREQVINVQRLGYIV